MSLTQQEAAMLATYKDDFDEIPSRAMYGEYLATRALTLAVLRDDSRRLTLPMPPSSSQDRAMCEF